MVAALSTAALLAVATTAASAHGGRGGPLRGAGASTLVTQAAKELGVARAKLKDAIVDSAVARIDEAVADGDVDKDDVADLKSEVADNLQLAIGISRTRTVASNLGISTAKLNDGFRAARKTLIVAQIDKALADKRIDKDRADDLKDDLDDADLPGYKGGLFGLGGLAFGGRGPGGFPHR
jgi:hypothetical protein